MKLSQLTALSIMGLVLNGAHAANPNISGETAKFLSPNNIPEICVGVADMPGAEYDEDDMIDEAHLCGINFYDDSIQLCPKTNSTSPGTRLYELEDGDKKGEQSRGKYCRPDASGSIGKFKQTMNQSGTSGTFAPSALMYYHMSRYLDTHIKVPVTVYRTMDTKAHFNLVTKYSPHGAAGMNGAGWQHLFNAESNPAGANASLAADLFTDSTRTTIFGNIMKSKGERYGAEFNGTRKCGWGNGQNFDIQRTPGFLALKSSKPLAEAIKEGEALARKDGLVSAALGKNPVSELQMVMWMRDFAEIAVMDYIFSQQDRVGNIDFTWDAVWREGDKIKSKRIKEKSGKKHTSRAQMDQVVIPEELKAKGAIVIQRTWLNDNDAGGMVSYANFTKSTGMINGKATAPVCGPTPMVPIQHFNPKQYKKLIDMNKDLQSKGPIYNYFASNFPLDPPEVQQIVNNTKLVVDMLQATCNSGKMRFDLDPKNIGVEQQIDCATGDKK